MNLQKWNSHCQMQINMTRIRMMEAMIISRLLSRANLSMIFPLIAVSREFSIKIQARLPDKISGYVVSCFPEVP